MTFQEFTVLDRPGPPKPAACFQNSARGRCRCRMRPSELKNIHAPSNSAMAMQETAARQSPRVHEAQLVRAGTRRQQRHHALLKGVRHAVARRIRRGRRRSISFAVRRCSYRPRFIRRAVAARGYRYFSLAILARIFRISRARPERADLHQRHRPAGELRRFP